MATIILRDNSTPNVRAAAASATAAAASATAAASSAGAAAAVGVSLVNPYLASKSARPGIISAGTAAVGTTQDNTGLAFGTGDLTIGFWMRLPDWTPSSDVPIVTKFASNLGIKLILLSGGSAGKFDLAFGNGSNFTTYEYVSASANTITDGSWALGTLTITRAGNAVMYLNGSSFATNNISASAAQTLTSTGALNWGNTGSSYMTGTLGECWIVSGLLTATQIANIYAAGSIAPFCTYTANTTTGQNTATIGGLSFFQWLDFGQGYGPIIRDRSGNNQHALMGTTGLTHAVPRNPPGRSVRAPKTAIVSDGAATSKAYAALNTQNPGTGDFVAHVSFRVPTTASAYNGPMALSSSTSTPEVGSGFYVDFTSAGTGLRVVFMNAANTGGRSITVSNWRTLFAGLDVDLFFRRSSSGLDIFCGVGGELFKLYGVEAQDASFPAWTDTVAGTYFIVAGRGNNSFSDATYDARLANVALTEAQLRTEYESGEPQYAWSRAVTTEQITATQDSTFASAGVGNWTAFGAGTTLANVGPGQLQFTLPASGTGRGVNLGRSFFTDSGTLGKTYRLRFTHQLISGSNPGMFAQLQGAEAAGVAFTPTASPTTVDRTFVVTGATTSSGIVFYTNNANSAVIGITNVSLVRIGYTARLRTDTAAGLTALNGSKSSTNDSTDFLLSTTGVTTSPDGRTQTIRAQTTTNGNQQLFGASVIDTTKKWRIRSWNITSTGTPTVSLGSASGGAQYVSGAVLTAATNEITLLLRNPTVANLWCNSNSTATLDHVIVLDQAE